MGILITYCRVAKLYRKSRLFSETIFAYSSSTTKKATQPNKNPHIPFILDEVVKAMALDILTSPENTLLTCDMLKSDIR